MPGRPVHENGGVGLFGNRATDLFEMKVHGFGIGERQHQGRAGIAGRADGAEQVGGFVTLICGLAWPGALSGPDAGAAILLADARFVLKPNLYCLACGHMAQVGSEDVGEVFLNAFNISGSCLGCCGRAVMREKSRALSNLEMVRS